MEAWVSALPYNDQHSPGRPYHCDENKNTQINERKPVSSNRVISCVEGQEDEQEALCKLCDAGSHGNAKQQLEGAIRMCQKETSNWKCQLKSKLKLKVRTPKHR